MKEQQPLLRASSTDSLVGAVDRRQNVSTTSQPSPSCPKCGRRLVHDIHTCPARNAICRKCHKRGHFQYVCTVSTNDGELELETVGTVEAQGNPLEVTLHIQNRAVTFSIDTGAEVTVVSEEPPELKPPYRKLKGPDSHTLSTLGSFTTVLESGRYQSPQQVYVVRGLD